MWSEVTQLVGAGAIALLVALVGIRMQLGARQRRVRRNLFEELELLRVLREQKRDAVAIERVEDSVDELELEYHRQLVRGPGAPNAVVIAIFPVSGAVVLVGVVWLFRINLEWWSAALAGAGLGCLFLAIIAVMMWVDERPPRIHGGA